MLIRTVRDNFLKISKNLRLNRNKAECPCPPPKKPKWEGNYNDLPQPDCSWTQKDAIRQQAHKRNLVVGVSVLLGTILFGVVTGKLHGYNYYPDRPADQNDYKKC